MRLPTLPREAGLWVGAACSGLAGGLAYKLLLEWIGFEAIWQLGTD